MYNEHLFKKDTLTCHQLEAPELSSPPERTQTHQVPFGEFSPISLLESSLMSPAAFLVFSVLNYKSNWQSGKTHRISQTDLVGWTGMSRRYVRDALQELKTLNILSTLSRSQQGTRYKLIHHRCGNDEIPTDRNGRPLKFAVPTILMESLLKGKLSWKSVVVWIMLKRYSDWETGLSYEINIVGLCNRCDFGTETIRSCLVELKRRGFAHRTNAKNVPGIYELFPKPRSGPRAVYRPPSDHDIDPTDDKYRAMRTDGDWRFSFNELWRVNVGTGEIQVRAKRHRGRWQTASDYQRHQEMPKPIKQAFDLAVKTAAELRAAVTDTAHPVTTNAHPVTDTACLFQDDMPTGDNSKG